MGKKAVEKRFKETKNGKLKYRPAGQAKSKTRKSNKNLQRSSANKRRELNYPEKKIKGY